MLTQFLSRFLFIFSLFFLLGLVSAQDDFDQTYINEARTFKVEYNDEWLIDEEDEDFVVFFHEDEGIYVTLYDPAYVVFNSVKATNLSETAEELAKAFELESEPDLSSIDERRVALLEESDFTVIVVELGDEVFGMVVINPDDIDAPLFEAMFVTYDLLSEEEASTHPRSLEDSGKTWQEAIAELQELEVIGTGGSLVFNENYAFFSGQGSWFTSLARNSPFTDIVMAGELTFTPGNLDELEQCILSSRLIATATGTTTYLDVGITNQGDLVVFDANPRTETPLIAYRPLELDLTQKVNILYLAIGDTITVYVNGKLIVEDAIIEKRAGTYGISLIGKGADARCEGRNIWVYQSPVFEKGVCNISSTGAVNKRSGPGTNFDRAGQLAGGVNVKATAQGNDGSFTWWKLEDESWVREDVVTASGDCASLPTEES